MNKRTKMQQTKMQEAFKQFKQREIKTKVEEIAALCKNFKRDMHIMDSYQNHINKFVKNDETVNKTINIREPGGSQDPDPGNRKLDGTLSTRMLGFVKFYKIEAGYGFIMPTDNKGDIYVHHTGIAKESTDKTRRGLNKFEMVEFNVIKTKRGLEAIGLTGPNGESVNGQSIIHDRKSATFYKKDKYISHKRPRPYNVRFKPKRNFRTQNQIFSDFVCPY